jgi:hypothetical protein
MPSTYTTNLGIEKIATGEQSGTWGTTTNTNLDLVDQAINGGTEITLTGPGTTGSPNEIDISNGAASDGRNVFIHFKDSGTALSSTAYVRLTPNDAEKVCYIKNSLTYAVGGAGTLVLFQGTYDVNNIYYLRTGQTAMVRFDGGGSTATVTNLTDNINVGTLSLNYTDITATASEINKLDGVTATTTELNYVDTTAGQGAPSKAVILDSNGDFEMQDDDKLKWGNDDDAEIYYNSSADDLTFVAKNNSGGFFFDSSGSGGYAFEIGAPNSAGAPTFKMNSNATGGTIPVNYNAGGSSPVNFQLRGTTYSSFTSTGVTHTTSHFYGDSDVINLGAGNDLKLSHDGTDSTIESETGTLNIIANGDESIVFKSDSPVLTGAQIEINTDRGELDFKGTGSMFFGTTSDNNAFRITGPTVSSYNLPGIYSLSANDNIYHVSDNIYFYKNGPIGGEQMCQMNGDGSVHLYYDGALKFSTETDGIRINDSTLTFEGDTADAYETKLVADDPTADATITIPNKTADLSLVKYTDLDLTPNATSVTINLTGDDDIRHVQFRVDSITHSSGPNNPTMNVQTSSTTNHEWDMNVIRFNHYNDTTSYLENTATTDLMAWLANYNSMPTGCVYNFYKLDSGRWTCEMIGTQSRGSNSYTILMHCATDVGDTYDNIGKIVITSGSSYNITALKGTIAEYY